MEGNMDAKRFILAIIGAIIVAPSAGLYWYATNTISEGNQFFGAGWETVGISKNLALMLQGAGVVGLVFGGILLLLGFVVIFKEQTNKN